ncbi:hypothetical protein F0U59_50840 [Archangium gephyra]|nr:hypothetical protein F0U59_50840 [Archangium gephyra]
MVGRPDVSPADTPQQKLASRWHRREIDISTALNSGHHEGDRDCPGCGYSVRSFRETCYVCGFEFGRE